MIKYHRCGYLITSILVLGLQAAVQAEILLTVDISDPSAIRFTATGGAASATKSVALGDGVTLLGLFASQLNDGNAKDLPERTLFAHGTANAYTTALVVNYQTGGTGAGYDLNLFGLGSSQSFVLGTEAFTGETVLYNFLSGANFASVGTTGNIVASYSQSAGQGTVIGQFQVIPEPSSLLLLAFSPLLLGFARWRGASLRLG